MPLPGGRVIPSRAAVIPAATGVVVLAAMWTPLLFWWNVPHSDLTATGNVVVGLRYLPMVALAPLLAAVTVAHHRRRRT